MKIPEEAFTRLHHLKQETQKTYILFTLKKQKYMKAINTFKVYFDRIQYTTTSVCDL